MWLNVEINLEYFQWFKNVSQIYKEKYSSAVILIAIFNTKCLIVIHFHYFSWVCSSVPPYCRLWMKKGVSHP